MTIIASLKRYFGAMFISDKQQRRKYKDEFKEREWRKLAARQKWGVSYSVFDGEELLEASIRSIRSSVDYINVVWQSISWYGAPANEGLLPLLLRLKEEKLIDELIEFTPDLSLKAGRNETRKRNVGLAAARKAGCTYFMPMDTDEFYKAEEMEAAKEFILQQGITHSYCAQNAYGTKPTELILAATCCCTFFTKLTPFSRHKNDKHVVALVDPTRKISHIPWFLGGSRHYFLHMVRMNHFSLIRKNILKKLQNSSNDDVRALACAGDSECAKLTCPDYFDLGKIIEKF